MAELTIEKKVDLDELKRVGIIAQNQKDTFLIRLRTVGGDLTARELNIIQTSRRDTAAARCISPPARAVEVPHVNVDDLEAARTSLSRAGSCLACADPAAAASCLPGHGRLHLRHHRDQGIGR